MTIAFEPNLRHRSVIKNYSDVLRALILRDIKSRFLGSAWGYLISIGWPLSHIVILLVIHGVFGRLQPYGDSAAVWYSSGIVPFMAFSYTLRFVVLGVLQNSPLLSFPVVRLTDIVFARAIVEIFSVAIVFFILVVIFELIGASFIPAYPLRAFYALFLSVILGLSFGTLFAVLAKISPAWNVISVLFTIVLWMSSGIFFVPLYFPDIFVQVLYYNPLIHVVDLFRSAYFDGFAEGRASWRYVVHWCLWSLSFSLFMERVLRGRIYQ